MPSLEDPFKTRSPYMEGVPENSTTIPISEGATPSLLMPFRTLSNPDINPTKKLSRETDPTKLSKTEFLDILDVIIYGDEYSDKWRDTVEQLSQGVPEHNKMAFIIMEFWKRTDTTFAEKFSLLKEIQAIIANYFPGDGYNDLEAGVAETLAKIRTHEENFFLQAIAQSFVSEKAPEYSLAEIRKRIQSRWEELVFHNGDTNQTFVDGVLMAAQEVHSVDDISDEEIRQIDNDQRFSDEFLFTPQKLHDFSLQEKFTDEELQENFITTYQEGWLHKQSLKKNNFGLITAFNGISLSSISPELGAVYNDLLVQEVFIKETAKKSEGVDVADIRLVIKSFSHLLTLHYGTNSLSDLIKKISPLLQNAPSILKKIYAVRQSLEKFPKIFQKGIPYDDILKEILSEILLFLQKEIASSTTRSFPIKDAVIEQLGSSVSEERARELAQLYESFTSLRMRNFFEDFFGFSLTNIPFRAQLQFIDYVHDKSRDDIEVIRSFINQAETPLAKAHRFTVFLALENSLPPETLYRVSQTLPVPIADKVFEKYAEIVSAENSIEKLLSHKDGQNKSVSKKSTKDISKKLLQQGCELLIEMAETKNLDEPTLLAKLEGLQVNIELLRTAFKTMKENGEDVSFEDFQDLDWQTALFPEQISEQSKWQMKKIYMENYPSPAYTPEFRTTLLSGLDARFQNPDCRFYLLRHKDGRIIGFNAFHNTGVDKEGHEHVYFGAFNVSKEFSQSKLGETILDTTLKVEGNNKITDAHCDSRSPISDKYLRSGFVATEFESISGSPSFSITRDADLNKVLLTKRTAKTMTIDVLKRLSKEGSPREYIQVVKLQNNTFPTEYFKQGFVLSQYRFGKDGTRYAVFEKPQSRKIGSKPNIEETPLLLAA